MNMLVTGGSGFLGRRTAAYFEKLGWQVCAPGHRDLDITREAELQAWFRVHQPEAVIHTAAVSDTGLCQRRPEWSETVNVAGSVNLAKVCRETGAKLVFCSSDQVYSGSAVPGPHREAETVTPNNVYGCQKLRAEQECLELLPETVCLRLSWMYARESLPGEHGHFLSVLTQALAEKTKPFCWPVHDRRGLTDVEFVVKNLPETLKLEGGIWNFASENQSSTYDTVKRLLEEWNLQEALGRLVPNEEAFRDNPRDISMDMTKLKTAGISFPTTPEGLRQAMQQVWPHR